MWNAQVLREKLDELIKTNDQLTNENKRLQILASRTSTSGSKGALLKTDDEIVNNNFIILFIPTVSDKTNTLDEHYCSS